MSGDQHECPKEIQKVRPNFVSHVTRENAETWLASLPYYCAGEETSVIITEHIAEQLISHWKDQVPVTLEFEGGISNGEAIEADHYTVKVIKS